MKSGNVLLFIFLLAASCNNIEGTGSKVDPLKDSLQLKQETIRDIEPNLWNADSIQVIYYDNPDGDSLRYSRFFTYTESSDTVFINILLREFNIGFTRHDLKKDCRSEGKLFLFNGEEVLKTIYFSTRVDSCSYLYFIKDGQFIYADLSQQMKELLGKNKRLAKKPEINKAD